MSCNGCRVLRKGCSDTCILRSCLQWIESPEAQGHATVFIAKFFGRAGMISFISAVAESQRPALFQSLLYEACGRTVNPVFGAVGLLWGGNWGICQAAVETVLRGGSLKPTACPPFTKPIQPLVLQKSHIIPSLKRPLSMTEENMSPIAEVKRFRSSDQHEEHRESTGKVDFSRVDHTVPVFLPNPEVNTASNPAFLTNSDASIQEQRPSPCGQLVAPVARRVKPQAGYGLAAMVIREHHQAPEEQESKSHEPVELDLSLNSHAQASGWAMARREDMKSRADTLDGVESHLEYSAFDGSLCNGDEQASFVEAARVSSPCSLSMNSEGSVTSSDTAEFSMSCGRTSSPATSRQEDCQLLHLL